MKMKQSDNAKSGADLARAALWWNMASAQEKLLAHELANVITGLQPNHSLRVLKSGKHIQISWTDADAPDVTPADPLQYRGN